MSLSIKSGLALFAFLFLGIASNAHAQPTASSPPIVAAGSGGNLGITRLLAQAFSLTHPEIKIDIPPSIGTKGAIVAVKENAVTIGLLSRALNDNEKAAGFIVQPFARTAVVMGAHPAVADDNLTSKDVVDIYLGTKNKWKDGKEIIVLTREPADSNNMALEKDIPGFKEAYEQSHQAKRWVVLFTDQDSNDAIAKTLGGVGLTDIGMIAAEKLPIKALKLNGVEATIDTLASGSYPLNRNLYLLYNETALPEGAKVFLDFIYSEAGASILKANGYLPMARVER